jgi:hypothetical protein
LPLADTVTRHSSSATPITPAISSHLIIDFPWG